MKQTAIKQGDAAVLADTVRIDEAKRALRNIPHHINCPGFAGCQISPSEPESCWQGEPGQPACTRIYQWTRIRYLERRLKKGAK